MRHSRSRWARTRCCARPPRASRRRSTPPCTALSLRESHGPASSPTGPPQMLLMPPAEPPPLACATRCLPPRKPQGSCASSLVADSLHRFLIVAVTKTLFLIVAVTKILAPTGTTPPSQRSLAAPQPTVRRGCRGAKRRSGPGRSFISRACRRAPTASSHLPGLVCGGIRTSVHVDGALRA